LLLPTSLLIDSVAKYGIITVGDHAGWGVVCASKSWALSRGADFAGGLPLSFFPFSVQIVLTDVYNIC